MTIMALVLVGILQMFSVSLIVNKGAAARTQMLFKCQQVVENVRCYYFLGRSRDRRRPGSRAGTGTRRSDDVRAPFPLSTASRKIVPSLHGDSAATWAYWGPRRRQRDGAGRTAPTRSPTRSSATSASANRSGSSRSSAMPTDVTTATQRFLRVGPRSGREWTMWRSSRSPRPLRGFTLVEAMVSLMLLVIVMVVSMTLLFPMRSFAERQQFFMQPRQTARRAADYLSYFLGGGVRPATRRRYAERAGHVLQLASNAASLVQASYNNLTGTETGNANVNLVTPLGTITSTNFGDLGTDIISVAVPTGPPGEVPRLRAPSRRTARTRTSGSTSGKAARSDDDVTNMALFKAATFESGRRQPEQPDGSRQPRGTGPT